MAPRLTPAKLGRWKKRIDTARSSIELVLEEVNEQTANSKAKHYQDLCDLRSDLRRVSERVELCLHGATRLKA